MLIRRSAQLTGLQLAETQDELYIIAVTVFFIEADTQLVDCN